MLRKIPEMVERLVVELWQEHIFRGRRRKMNHRGNYDQETKRSGAAL